MTLNDLAPPKLAF